LSANPTTITAGQSSTLTWQATNATTVTITPDVGNVTANGNRQVTPPSSVTYTATAIGPGVNAGLQPVRITVNAPPPPPPVAPPPVRPPAPSLTLREQFDRIMVPILFDYDKSEIRKDQESVLLAEAAFLKQNAGVRFTVQGHADERGSQEYNIALGDERALAVKKYLEAQGVVESRMLTSSYGEERPTCNAQTEECFSKNRRAQYEWRDR
jgi:peptidoglycan-associated lipoprotein